MPPVIAITTSFDSGEQRLFSGYANCLERSGALPIIAPVFEREDTVGAFVSKIDGLLITGGPAVVEGLVGELAPELARPDPLRSLNDGRLLEQALTRDLPVFGICYGMQLINAYFGGTIYGDVDRQSALSESHSEERGGSDHAMRIEKGSRLHDILRAAEVRVNSRHVQAIAECAPPLVVSGRAPDGVIEAVESGDGRVFGTQFHPERMPESMKPLFDHLVLLAKER